MKSRAAVGISLLSLISGGASADIASYTASESQMGSTTNFADFNELVVEQSLYAYQEDGLQVSTHRDYFSWNAPGLDGSEMYYANTGSLELVDITKVDGSEFNDVEMQVASGWSPDEIGTMYLWVQAYSGASLVAEFDIDMLSGGYLGLTGGGYDLIKVGSYASAELRDQHDSSLRNAIAIDNLSAGTVVPSPGTLMIPALAGIGFVRRRR